MEPALIIVYTTLLVLCLEIMNANTAKKKYHCPRCQSKDIYDYGARFECTHCLLEFEKKDFETLDGEDILTVSEKIKIASVFREMTDMYLDD